MTMDLIVPTELVTLDKALLAELYPMSRLSPARLDELASVCFVEHINQDLDPTRMNIGTLQALYLVKGDLGIRYINGEKIILRGGTEASKYPVDSERLKIRDTIALTPIEVVRVDVDLLDIMLTWDQISGDAGGRTKSAKVKVTNDDFKLDAESFSAFKLKNGVFAKLPPANIEALMARFTSVTVSAGETIISQGQEGDYYYLIQQGTAVVSRIKDPLKPPVELAEIAEGAAFGEEALVSDTKRNATVKMKTDGRLLRLKKQDFVELLKAPIVNTVDYAQAEQHVANGAVWLDVRFESEYSYHHLDGAINIPIHELRSRVSELDKQKEYVVYCQTGRRSSAATFVLAQYGINSVVLENGTRSIRTLR